MVGGADDAVAFHLLDDGCGPIITDLQMSLHKACRGFLFTDDKLHRLVIEAAALAEKIAGGASRRPGLLLLGGMIIAVALAAL